MWSLSLCVPTKIFKYISYKETQYTNLLIHNTKKQIKLPIARTFLKQNLKVALSKTFHTLMKVLTLLIL